MEIKFIKKIIYDLILSVIISTIIFAIYVEINPKMTNIWFRINSNGEKTIQLINLFHLMVGPLYYDFYWYPNYLDINYFMYLLLSFLFIGVLNYN
jgi:hypothetical protein